MSGQLLTQLLHELDEQHATDIKTIDVKMQTSIADHMIIATGRSSRHVRAMAENITLSMKKKGMIATSIQGLEQSEWVLIDFDDVIVHLMQPETRAFYHLETLWHIAPSHSS